MVKQTLKFQAIEFNNFRPYKNSVLEFSQDPKRTITVVEGRNAAGKTSIIHGIEWCLYGEEKIDAVSKGKPRCNINALNQLKVGESITTSVKITLSDNSGPKYQIERVLTGKKNFDSKDKHFETIAGGTVPNGFAWSTAQNFGEKTKSGGWDITEDVDLFRSRLYRIFPKGIFEFIVFDGERLDSFFKYDSTTKIKTGIEKVSGLPILESAILHWDAVEKRFARYVAKKSGTDATLLQDNKERLEREIKKLGAEISTYKTNYVEIKTGLVKLEVERDKMSISEIDTLEQHLAAEQVHKKEYANIIEKTKKQRQNCLIENFPRFLCLDIIKNATDILKDSEEKQLTPPPVKDFFLAQILSKNKCICGAEPLSEKAVKAISALKEQVRTTQIADLASEGKILLNGILDSSKPKEIEEELDGFTALESRYQAALSEATGKVNGLMYKLEESNKADIRKNMKSLATLRGKSLEIEQQINLKESLIDAKKVDLKDVEDRLEKAEGLTTANKQWKAKREFAQKTLSYFQRIKHELVTEIRIQVQKRTTEIFIKLMARGLEIKRIDIDEAYNMNVLDSGDNNILPNFSAGQYLLLSLSYIAAVRDVTDTNYPMIVDSPLGRIAGLERVYVAKTLPIYLEGTQISLLVTNAEYDAPITKDAATGERIPSVKEVWEEEKRIWKRFIIKFDKDETGSADSDFSEFKP